MRGTMADHVLQAQAERVWFRLFRTQSRLHSLLGETLKPIGLSVPQHDVLATLTEREGVTQQELAQRLYVTKGNISGLIDRLEAASLVERRPIPNDRRAYAIYLTEEGRRAAEAGIGLQRDLIAATFGQMTLDQLQPMEELIVTLRNHIRTHAGSQSTPSATETKFMNSGGRPVFDSGLDAGAGGAE